MFKIILALLSPGSLESTVDAIRSADYRADRQALTRLHEEAGEYLKVPEAKKYASYWRGFALWRRAINGFNETPAPRDLESDLKRAIMDFDVALSEDATFTDAKIGKLGCMGLIGYLHMSDQKWLESFYPDYIKLQKEFSAEERRSPRFIWVVGPGVWKTPDDQGGGEDRVLKLYGDALTAIRS